MKNIQDHVHAALTDSMFYRTVRSLEPLLRRHRTLEKMDFDMLIEWVAYFWNRNTISHVIDNGKPRAVCMIKLFRRLQEFQEPFVHDPCNKFCMIELMSASDPEAMGIVHDRLFERWGPQMIVMWDRGERTEKGRPRMYRWDQFERLAEKLTHKENTYGIS
jgi:hypothetical protein